LLLPGRCSPVDLNAPVFGKLRQGIPIRRMQPAAAEIEREAVADDGTGTSAEAIRCFEQDERAPSLGEPASCGNAGCPAADDGDVEYSVGQGFSAQ
jgi:hypothetical protein